MAMPWTRGCGRLAMGGSRLTLHTWLAFCTTEALLCLIPGPAVLFVVSTGLSRGRRAAFFACLGILAGNAFYFGLSSTGVAALIIASHDMFTALKWCGAGYLVWQGVSMLLRRGETQPGALSVSGAGSFARAFGVQTSNPKTLVFFVALLPQFIDAGAPLAPQVLVMGASSFLIELAVLAIYISVSLRVRRIAESRLERSVERAGGAVLIALGVRIAFADDS
jgi:homoserine/homoserine lactone efflux protein